MMTQNSVMTLAVKGIVPQMANRLGVSDKYCYRQLGEDCYYQKTKRWIGVINEIAPERTHLIKADMDTFFSQIMSNQKYADDISLADLNRECFEAVNSVIAGKSKAEQRKELTELIAIAQRYLASIPEE